MIPVYSETISSVNGHQTAELLFAFDPFAVPKGKRLIVQIGEKNNGRFLQLRIKGKRILQAKALLRNSNTVADPPYK